MTRNLILLLSVACLVAVAVLSGEHVLSGTSEEGALAADARTIMQTLPHLNGPPSDARHVRRQGSHRHLLSPVGARPVARSSRILSDIYLQHREAGLEVVAINLFEDFDNFSDDERLVAFLEADPTPLHAWSKATTPSRNSSAPFGVSPACLFSTVRAAKSWLSPTNAARKPPSMPRRCGKSFHRCCKTDFSPSTQKGR